MAVYKFLDKVDKNKVFIIKKSEISNRLDPELLLYDKEISVFQYPLIPLKKLLIKDPQYGANETGIERQNIDTPRYIRITDIDEKGNLKKYLGKTAKTVEEKFILNNNDILFARSGNTVGKSYLHRADEVEYSCFFAGYMIRFVVNQKIILPDYLFIYTQLEPYKKWVKAIMRTAGQPNINAEEYKTLKIPTPSTLKEQQKIIDLYNKAYKIKQTKEEKAKELLNSIDTYLLNELGITLPKKDNSLNSRIFQVNFSDVSGQRLDAISSKAKDYENALLLNKFGVIKLKKLVTNIKTGTTPNKTLNPYIEKGVPFLRNTNIQKGELDLSKIKNIKEELSENLTYSFKDEVIICIAGTVGESAINNSNIKLAINQNITSLQVDKKQIDVEFLNYYFNTKLSINLVKRQCSIATILYINNSNLLDLYIPFPPVEKQKEIANHIKTIRTKAKRLQLEASAVLENAKQEVEELILGK